MSWGAFDVTVSYGGLPALSGVTLPIPAGEVTAVVGGDGAGKTTLLRAMAGAIAPTSGRVERPDTRDIGFVPTATGTFRDLTVAENLEFVAGAYGVRGQAFEQRRRMLLDATGLHDATDRLASRLTGGMRQKLAFAMAMLHQPALLVLDEPTTGVDPVSRVDLWRLIAQTAARGTAVVLSTTYIDEAERASNVLVLDASHTLLFGSPDEVIAAAPGSIVTVDAPTNRARAWRRGRTWREWRPDSPGRDDRPGQREAPRDLEDTVVAAALAFAAAAEATSEAGRSA